MGLCIALLGASRSRKGCWVCSSPWLGPPGVCRGELSGAGCAPGHGAGLPKSMPCSVPSQGRCLTLSIAGPVRVFKPGRVLGSAGSVAPEEAGASGRGG